MNVADFIGLIVGFLLTVLVFTYIFGDNPFFRLIMSIFVGVAAGFAIVVTGYNVFWNQIARPLINDPAVALIRVLPPLVLGLWLLLKMFPRFSPLANPAMAFFVGAGAATAIGGGVLGTLFPQVGAAASSLDLQAAQAAGLNTFEAFGRGIILVVGTITTLAYFHFGTRQTRDGQSQRLGIIDGMGEVGQVFIAITFGVLFAGVYSASLSAMIERLRFLVNFLLQFLVTK